MIEKLEEKITRTCFCKNNKKVCKREKRYPLLFVLAY